MNGQKPVVTVRFPPGLVAAAKQQAGRDGVPLSAWVRRLVGREVARRGGVCPACGQRCGTHEDQ